MRREISYLLLFLASCGSTPARVETPETTTETAEPTTGETTAPSGPPVAELRPVTHSYHGTDVVDPYEWLENADDPAVRAWSDAQNRHARAYLAALPGMDPIRARVREVLSSPSRSHRQLVSRGGKIFALEFRPPREQPFVVVMDSADQPDAARVIVDPTAIDASGAVSIDWFVPSNDARLLAVSLSRGGSERGDVHVFDVATGQQVHEVIAHVNGGTAGGDLAWLPDGSGFFYTRYPREGERSEEDRNFYQQLWFHALGTPVEQDRYELGRDLPRIAEIQLEMHAASGRLLATVQNGDGGEFAIYLRAREGEWRQLCDFDDGIVQAAFGPRDDLYVVSRQGAPRGKVLRVAIRQLDVARASVVIPEGTDSIVTDFWMPPTVLPTRTKLYVTYQTGGPSELRVFDLRGRAQSARPEQPPVSAVHELVALDGDSVLIRVASFVQPSAWLRFDGSRTHPTSLRETTPFDTSTWEVRREMATSRDGTQVPVNILIPQGAALDGTSPCIATGYGGYGVNIEPSFRDSFGLYLERGIIVAVVNLRGGAEFGEDWHRAGMLTNKQNVFDDFAAALQHLIANRYTSSARLGIVGGSNGGLLMGAMLTQHPELVRAVVSFVGIYDMLRVELSPNGAFNVTEFGTVTDEAQFRALHAYSPLHHVEDDTAYPATLFVTGANDPRVEPWHSRKMTARLQAANSAQTPILLRTSDTSGHGMGTALSEEIEEMSDVAGFLFAQLGVTVN
jgi:prolyl oligopeptidase